MTPDAISSVSPVGIGPHIPPEGESVVASLLIDPKGRVRDGQNSRKLSSPEDRRRFLALRRWADVILVGSKTFAAESYEKTRVPVIVFSRCEREINDWSLEISRIKAGHGKKVFIEAGFGEAVLEIDWQISQADLSAIAEIRTQVEKMLVENGLEFKALYNPASTGNKVEDVYHPVGCLRVGSDPAAVVDFDGQVNGLGNLFHFSTALFPSAKSINPSAAVMCFVEEHLEHWQEFLTGARKVAHKNPRYAPQAIAKEVSPSE